MSTKEDADMVHFEVSKSDQEPTTEWRVNVKCQTGLSEQEFAASLQSLAEDIVAGRVSFDSAPLVINPDHH